MLIIGVGIFNVLKRVTCNDILHATDPIKRKVDLDVQDEEEVEWQMKCLF